MKRIVKSKIALVVVVLSTVVMVLNACTSAPTYQGAATNHFDGRVFVNRIKSDKTPWDIVRLFSTFEFYKQEWPTWVENDAGMTSPMVERSQALRVTFINHSTFLIQVDNVNILTDPVYSHRVSPFRWVGPKRVRDPGIALSDLPPIDVVLISHNHYDHLDIDTLQALYKQQDGQEPMVLAGLGNRAFLQDEGIMESIDMDWQQTVTHHNIPFTFVETRHRSGRGMTDQMKTLWGGFVIETSQGPVYFAGDTGYGPHFSETRARFGDMHLSLLPIGAYEPRWFMKAVHLDPAEAVKAHQDLGSQHSISMHFGTFQLTLEGIGQPEDDLALALAKHGVDASAFQVLAFGETALIP